jgi:hypothetical protein
MRIFNLTYVVTWTGGLASVVDCARAEPASRGANKASFLYATILTVGFVDSSGIRFV